MVGTLHARSAQWINRIQLHVITIAHNRHMPCPPSGRTPQRHLGGWWKFILRERESGEFGISGHEVLHRSYALFSPAHLAVASIRTLRRCIELISGFGALVLEMEWLCGEAQAWWAPHGCARHAVATCLPGAAALGLGGARTRKRRGTPFEGGGSGSDALRLEEGVEADVPAASTSQHHASQRESILATGAGAYAQPTG